MILAIDVYYYDNKAKSVGLLFKDWSDSEPQNIISAHLDNILEYESGNFYKRELPCLIALLEQIDLSIIDTIVVDSFVYLNDDKKLGLGGYLHEQLENKIPIIGVAKNYFHLNQKNVSQIYRGDSKKPLYISSVGIDLNFSTSLIKNMHGKYRFPTLLKLLDQETKKLD